MTSRSMRFARPRQQKAVLWAVSGATADGGRTFSDAAEIDVRWEDRSELFIDENGQERQSSAVVWTGQDVTRGSYLYLGTLASLSSSEEADPQVVAEAHEVRQTAKVPNRRSDAYERRVWL